MGITKMRSPFTTIIIDIVMLLLLLFVLRSQRCRVTSRSSSLLQCNPLPHYNRLGSNTNLLQSIACLTQCFKCPKTVDQDMNGSTPFYASSQQQHLKQLTYYLQMSILLLLLIIIIIIVINITIINNNNVTIIIIIILIVIIINTITIPILI